MRLVQKVFYKELLWSILGVLLGFVMLFVTIDSFSELSRIGRADYTLSTLIQIVLLKVPEYIYQLLPICALIGGVLALSNMAARSELVVWRVSGLSLARLIRIVVSLGIILAGLLWVLGDLGIAKAEHKAKQVADKALHRNQYFSDAGGYWSRQNLPDGGFRMINVKNIQDNRVLENVSLYDLTPDFTLSRSIEAKSANEQSKSGVWMLNDVRQVQIQSDAQGLVTGSQESRVVSLEVDLAENTLAVMQMSDARNTNMTSAQLQERINTLKATGQNPRSYEVAYWQKMIYPLGIIVMLLLALPFAFMQTRKGGVGVRVFTGILLGLLFFVLTAMAQYLGGLIKVSPIVLASAPSVLFLLIAVVWIYRVTRV